MKRSNVIGILAAAAVIVLSVVLISWYLTKRTPTLIQGTVECTTYKASSKVPGRIDDMKVAQGDRVEKGQLLYTLSTPELEAKLRQAEAVMLRAESCQCVSVGIEQESFYFCRKAIRSLSLESYILMSNGQESAPFREELNIKIFCKRRQIESFLISILGIIELYFNVACGNRLQIRQGNRNQPILICLSFTFIFNLSVFNVAVADGSISESLLSIAGKSYLGCIM